MMNLWTWCAYAVPFPEDEARATYAEGRIVVWRTEGNWYSGIHGAPGDRAERDLMGLLALPDAFGGYVERRKIDNRLRSVVEYRAVAFARRDEDWCVPGQPVPPGSGYTPVVLDRAKWRKVMQIPGALAASLRGGVGLSR
jgi:hypothetical protein